MSSRKISYAMLRSLRPARSGSNRETYYYSVNVVFLIIFTFLLIGALELPSFISFDTSLYPYLVLQEALAQDIQAGEAAADTSELLTYENDTYGIRIKYPADWTYFGNVETGGVTDIVLFQAPLEGRSDPSSAQFDVFTDTLPSDRSMSLKEYAEAVINSNKLSDPTLNVIESSTDGSITLLGNPAYKITDSYVLDNTTYMRMEIGTFVDGKVYAIAYDADEAEFYKNLPIAQEMINSFELLGLSANTTTGRTGTTGETNLVNVTSAGNFTTMGSSNITDTSATAAPNQTTIPTTFANYENATYGVKVQYPSDWQIKQDPSNLAFISPLESMEDPFREGLAILLQNIQFSNGTVMSLDDYVNSVISSFEQSGVNINISDWVPTNLTSNGNPAMKLVYTWNNGEMEMKTMDIYTINGNNAYTISYGTPVDKFESFIPTVQKMIDSFEILPALGDTSPETNQSQVTWKTFKDRDNLFTAHYPSNWAPSGVADGRQGPIDMIFSAPSSGVDVFAQVELAQFAEQSPFSTTKEAIESEVSVSKNDPANTKFEIKRPVECSKYTLNGLPACSVIYEARDLSGSYAGMSVDALAPDGTEYTAFYTASLDEFKHFFPTAESMIESFQTTETSSLPAEQSPTTTPSAVSE